MGSIIRAIERFCYNRPRFGIPGLIRYVVFGTAIVYFFGMMDTTNTLYGLLSFSPEHILRGQIWRLFTFVLVPTQSQLLFFIITLYLSYMLGTTLEQTWGTPKFTIFYLMNVALLAISSLVLHLLAPLPFTELYSRFVNGYYLHIFLLFVFTTLYPDLTFRFMFVLPMRAKWIGFISLAFLLSGLWQLRALFPHNLIPLALAFSYFVFCGEELKRHFKMNRTNAKTIQFRRAAKKVEKDRKAKAYTRKCTVCGKTDTDHPDLEFRYCSRCVGYHCFCLEHINDHIHAE